MMPISIQDGDITIRNLKNSELVEVYNCVNQSHDSLKALGRNSAFSLEDIKMRYLETLINSMEFFCGILYKDKIVGLIKGRIEYKEQNQLFIMSLMLIEDIRGKGIGTKTLGAFEDYFFKNFSTNKFCALIMENNKSAQKFWIKNGYKFIRATRGIGIDEGSCMIILEKELNSNG